MHRGKKGCFRKPISLPLFLTSSPPQINRLHTRRSSAGYWTVSPSPHWPQPAHHVNPYNSVSPVPVSTPTLIIWAGPWCHLHRCPCSASKGRSTHCEYSCADNRSSLHRSHPLPCAAWTQHGGWGRTEDGSLHSGPLCLSLGFLNWWMFYSCSYDFIHWVPLVVLFCFLITWHLRNDIPIILELRLEL